jgi:MSHA pilin protein MshC
MTVRQQGIGARPRGYTLIELVLVIVIAGILAAIVGPHFFDQSVFAQRGYADAIGAALRIAQKTAVASDCPAEVNLASGAYSVQQQAASGNSCNPNDMTWSTPVVGLDGEAVTGSAPSNASAGPLGSYVFNGSGALSSAPATTITVGTATITIDAQTGFVQVQ